LYGFRRLTKGDDQGAYFHPKFQRGRRDLLQEIRRLPGKGSVPAVDYSGFEDFISHRISSNTNAAPQMSYNLRPIEHDRSISDYAKAEIVDDDRDIYAKSYSRATRNTRSSSMQTTNKSAMQRSMEPTSLNYDNGNDVYNMRSTRKRPMEDPYRPIPPPLPLPMSMDGSSTASAASGNQDLYNFNNLGMHLKDSNVSSMYPRSKSKLTMNIGFEKIAGSSYLSTSSTSRRPDAYIPSLPASSRPAMAPSSSTYAVNPTASQQVMSRTRSNDPSPFSQLSDFLVLPDQSFEEYNRRKFDQASGKVADLDQFDFDSMFASQPE
jgi:hypothetical protein